MDDLAYLLEQAERCRRLARQIGPPHGQTLRDMAGEYEVRAQTIVETTGPLTE